MPRFNDNQDGTITDSETSLTWQKKDSRQLTGRWMHLEKSQKLAKELGFNRFRAIVGDKRTPKHMILKSKTWEEVEVDLSEM